MKTRIPQKLPDPTLNQKVQKRQGCAIQMANQIRSSKLHEERGRPSSKNKFSQSKRLATPRSCELSLTWGRTTQEQVRRHPLFRGKAAAATAGYVQQGVLDPRAVSAFWMTHLARVFSHVWMAKPASPAYPRCRGQGKGQVRAVRTLALDFPGFPPIPSTLLGTGSALSFTSYPEVLRT